MVYYGAVSRGCQRCRQRKIKCDQRRPGCSKCERSNIECPGYRDLQDILFRDESARVVQRLSKIERSKAVGSRKLRTAQPRCLSSNASLSELESLTPSSSERSTISRPLSPSAHELGANFFFTKYSFTEPPFSSEYHDWLTQSYLECPPTHTLRSAIEAVGMAGMSNVSHAPNLASKSKYRYQQSLASMQEALKDPCRAVADTTFMAVILLGFFVTLDFETGDRYRSWEAHVHGALLLLELRGQEQFDRRLGGQLYVQIRSQILLACMQQQMAVPPALIQTALDFRASRLRQHWQRQGVASPASLSEISFRVVNLSAAMNTATPQVSLEEALDVDDELEKWGLSVPPSWAHATINGAGNSESPLYVDGGMRHVYPNGVWIAEIWNNWRVLRILTNQAILRNELNQTEIPDVSEQKWLAISIIHRLSADLCLSVTTFKDSPRMLSLIRPMYVVAMEEVNPSAIRKFALEQLRSFGASMGIRQACLLADTVSKCLDGSLRHAGGQKSFLSGITAQAAALMSAQTNAEQ